MTAVPATPSQSTGAGRRAEACQPDVHPAVEQDRDQRDRDDALVDLDRQVAPARGRASEAIAAATRKIAGAGIRQPLADPVGEHREQRRQRHDRDRQPERHDVVHLTSMHRLGGGGCSAGGDGQHPAVVVDDLHRPPVTRDAVHVHARAADDDVGVHHRGVQPELEQLVRALRRPPSTVNGNDWPQATWQPAFSS